MSDNKTLAGSEEQVSEQILESDSGVRLQVIYDDDKPSQPDLAALPQPEKTKFYHFFVYVFFVGLILVFVEVIVQFALTFAYDQSYGVYFQAVNVVTAPWLIIGVQISLCFSPRQSIIVATMILTSIILILGACVSYVSFESWAGCLSFIIPAIAFLKYIPLSGLIHRHIVSLPVTTLSLQTWATVLKYTIVVITPILVNIFLEPDVVSTDNFFPAAMFAFGASYLATNIRVHACLMSSPSESFGRLLSRLSLKQLVVIYGPAVGLLCVFAIIYLPTLSRIEVDPTLSAVLLGVSSLLIILQEFLYFIMIARWRVFEFIKPERISRDSLLDSGVQELEKAVQQPSTESISEPTEINLMKQKEKTLLQLSETETFIRSAVHKVSFPHLLVYIFFAGTVLSLPIMLTQVILLLLSNDVPKTPGLWIFNLLASCWNLYSMYIGLCYSPKQSLLQIHVILVTSSLVLMSVWAYFVFDILSTVFYASGAFFIGGLLLILKPFFKFCTSLPVEDMTLQVFFTCWRIFIVVTVPTVSAILQGNATQVSFFAVTLFALGSCCFCLSHRHLFPMARILYNGNTIHLIQHLSLRTFIQLFMPGFGLFSIFAIFYIIDLSKSSLTIPNTVVPTLLGLSVIFMMMTFVNGISLNFPFGIVTAWLNPIQHEDLKAFKKFRKESKAKAELITTGAISQNDLKQQKKELKKALVRIKTELSKTVSDNKNGVRLMQITNFACLILVLSIVPVWFAEVVLLLLGQSEVANTPSFWIFNILSNGLLPLCCHLIALYPYSAGTLRLAYTISAVGYVLISIWSYITFGVLAVIFYVVILSGYVLHIFLSPIIHHYHSRLPFEGLSFGLWFSGLKYFLLFASPIIVQYLQHVAPNQETYFAVTIFCITVCYLSGAYRFWSTKHPAATNAVYFFRQNVPFDLAVRFGPSVICVTLSVVFYIFAVSKLSLPISANAPMVSLASLGILASFSHIYNFSTHLRSSNQKTSLV